MATSQDTTKICAKCKQLLPLTAFNKRGDRKHGVTSECGPCLRHRAKEYHRSPRGQKKRAEYAQQPTAKQRALEAQRNRRKDPEIRERQNAYAREWRKKNWEKVKKYQYKWRKNNPDKWKAVHKRRYYKDVEATRARDRARRARKWIENPEQIKMWLRMANHRRKAHKLNARGTCSKVQFLAKCNFWGWRCLYCKVTLTLKTVTLEHRVPLVKGGSNWPANIAPACPACNSMKGDKTEREYRQVLTELQAAGWQPKYPDKTKRRGRKPRTTN